MHQPAKKIIQIAAPFSVKNHATEIQDERVVPAHPPPPEKFVVTRQEAAKRRCRQFVELLRNRCRLPRHVRTKTGQGRIGLFGD
jgi:hypothetical protein